MTVRRCGRLSPKKTNLTEAEKSNELKGDRWTYVNVLPKSGFIQTVVHGKRNESTTDQFIGQIKASSDGQAPLFLSDGFAYETSLKAHYCTWEEPPYSGRGRPKNPIQQIDPKLKYAQVIKHQENGKLVELESKICLGEEADILEIIQSQTNAKSINTSYVETRNGNFRKDNKRLTRKSQCHSKKVEIHDAQIDFRTAFYNFCTDNQRLREEVNPNAKRFETKYRKISPAMAEGLTEKIYSLEELLMIRIPS